MSDLAEFPRGNNFPMVVSLEYQTEAGNVAVDDLPSAVDIVAQIGIDPKNPDLIIDLASGKIAVDTPEVGDVTISVLSTDSIDMSLGTNRMSIQVKYLANDTNNVEWNSLPVFKLMPNNVAPLST